MWITAQHLYPIVNEFFEYGPNIEDMNANQKEMILAQLKTKAFMSIHFMDVPAEQDEISYILDDHEGVFADEYRAAYNMYLDEMRDNYE